MKRLLVLSTAFFFSMFLSLCVECRSNSSFNEKATSKKKVAVPCQGKTTSSDSKKQENSVPVVAPEKRPDTLVVIGRLIEIPGRFATNDLYNYVYIMKYRVMKVVKGTYKGEVILVGHYNPLIPRSRIRDKMAAFVSGTVTRFETGAQHELALITPIERVWKKAVEDDYVDSDLDKYYALRADIVR